MSSLLSLSSENLTRKKESKGQNPLNKALYPTIGRWLAIIKRLKKKKEKLRQVDVVFLLSKTNWVLNIGDDPTIQFGKGNMINQKERKRRKEMQSQLRVIKWFLQPTNNSSTLYTSRTIRNTSVIQPNCPNWEPSNY